ncbi:MAG: right-handed parallel beta-helix repeat-containing protein [Chthoniobacterales bacterium]|nr:right-handed parallel beta-helix repeat-containing protein [Chthoniobacterales bacterium]
MSTMKNLVAQKFPRVCFSVLGVWALLSFRLMAGVYYVAPQGNDAWPGTLSRPWRTIQKAASVLTPGDTVFVRGGVYREAVTMNVSGEPARPITFAAYPRERPILDGTGLAVPRDSFSALFFIRDCSHIVILGFEIRNFKTSDIRSNPVGIFIGGNSSHIVVRDCTIHSIWNTGGSVDNSGSAFAIAVYGDSLNPCEGIVIENNRIFNCKTGWSETVALNGNVRNFVVQGNRIFNCNNIGIDFIGFEGTCPDPAQDQARDGICRGNVVWNISSRGNQAYPAGDFSAPGIYVDGGTRILIENNICHSNDIGIELASETPGKTTSEITLRNNQLFRNRQSGLLLGGYAETDTGGTERCLIEGNQIWNNDTLMWDSGEIQLRYRTSHCTVRNNTIQAGPSNLLVVIPVASRHNVANIFDQNIYFAPGGAQAARWVWNLISCIGFSAWKELSGQDANSQFSRRRLP